MPKSTKPRLRDRLGIGGRSSRATSPVPPPASNSNPATAQPLSVLIVTGGSPTPSGDENPAFAEALKRHIQEISSAEQQAFLDSDKITESSILQRIREHDETHCSKSYQRKCAPGVTKFLTALKTYMGPVTTMIGHSPEFSSLVVGGFKLIVDLGLKLVNFFDRLTAMLEFLSVHLGYLATYGTTFRESTEVQEALILTYRDLLQFFTKARKVFVDKEGKPKRWVSFRVFWRVSWEDFESEYQQLSSQFSNHSMTVVRIANAEEYGRIRNKETLEQRNQEREERRKILLWLSDLDFDHDHDRIFSTRHDDTGRWLVESREFTQWHDSQESSILWCHGTPGVGKTVLTSIVLETISARHCANDRVGLAFFYFNFQRQERQTPVKVLGTFLKQLARQRQQLPDHLKLFHRYYYKDALFPSEQKLEAQLIELSSSFERVFLIIDAMDEHDDRKPTLAMLTRLAQNGPAIFKVFFTSRKEKDINRAFEKFPTIQVEARMVDRDIRKYIMDQMHHRTAETSIDEQLKAEITNTLISQSNGMFLWVKFQLDNIYSQPTSREIRKALRSLPEDIDATYNRILEKIDKQGATERKAARRALCWIAGAARPLTPDELSTAVSLEPEDTHFLGLESYGIEWIIGVCGNLLFHDEEASLIRPVHMTVVEFLKDFNIDDCDSGTPKHLKKYKFINAMHTSLAMQCLQVISFQDIQVQTSLRGFLGPSRFGNQPFLGYSSRYWVFHYRALSSVPAILFEAISRFLTSPRRPFQVANSIAKDLNKDVTVEEFCVDLDLLDLYLSISPFNQERLTEQPYLLFIAAKEGHIASMQKLLDIGFDINKEMYGNTALIYALSLGQEEAATILLARGANANLPDISLCVRGWNTSTKLFKLLVEKGADVIGQCYYGRNVLQWATISGRDGIVKFLIDKGIHPDAQPFGSSGTASLYHAAEMGNLGIVRLLLSRGADPVRQGGQYHSALGTAVYMGRLEIVRLLLERGADPTQECGHHHSVLEAAVYLDRLEVAKLLLEYGADPTQQGGHYGSALGAAAYSGRLEMVKLLLEHGADPTQQGGHYGSALGVAVHSGYLEIVKLFLEHGADPTLQGRLYGSALGAAVHSGHLGIVKLLLEHGAGHTEQGGHYGSALGVAARLGHLEVVKLLLEYGANPTQQDGHYVSALGAAACSGHLEVVKLLLEHGVDPTEQGGLEGSALAAAACSGHLEIVKLLLEHGAYPTQHDRLYGSALGAAACSGHLEVVKLLLEHGVNPTEQGGPEGSALAAAVCSGDLEIVKLLLEHGADPTQQDGHYGSALGVAACLGHLEVVELLLERGADATEQGGHYGSALGAAACSGEPEIVELLLEHGADPTEQGGHYGSALGVAACSGHLEVVELLLEHGADPTEQGGHYGSALGVAAYSGYLEVVESLLQHGADPTQQGGYYGSALIAAALTGANGTITLLLDRGADIDYRGGFYHSTIVASVIYALRSDNIETLDLLIDNGADIYSQCGQNANDLLDAINSRHLRDPILQRDSYIQGLRSMGLFSERRLQCLQRQEGWGLYDSYLSDSDME